MDEVHVHVSRLGDEEKHVVFRRRHERTRKVIDLLGLRWERHVLAKAREVRAGRSVGLVYLHAAQRVAGLARLFVHERKHGARLRLTVDLDVSKGAGMAREGLGDLFGNRVQLPVSFYARVRL